MYQSCAVSLNCLRTAHMITVRPARQRGHANYGWLDTYHTFSFARYRDPAFDHFRALRVMNEDWVAPGSGFGEHPHNDMEIVTYVLEGALEHRDSMGNGEVLRSGEFQRMTAGKGIMHSEFNPSDREPVHLYQIWLYPERRGLEPSYEQKSFSLAGRLNRLQLVASRDAREGSLRIHQDATIYLSKLEPEREVPYYVAPGRHAWLQVLRGNLAVNGTPLETGDGAAITAEQELAIRAADESEVMLFDLA
jgi:quercetin 2,3-dioxygenase